MINFKPETQHNSNQSNPLLFCLIASLKLQTWLEQTWNQVSLRYFYSEDKFSCFKWEIVTTINTSWMPNPNKLTVRPLMGNIQV